MLESLGLTGFGLYAAKKSEGFKRGETIGWYTGFPEVSDDLCYKYKWFGTAKVRAGIPRAGCWQVRGDAGERKFDPIQVADDQCRYAKPKGHYARCFETTSCNPSSLWTMEVGAVSRRRCAEAKHTSTDPVRYINDCRPADVRAGHCPGLNAEYFPTTGIGMQLVTVRAKKAIKAGEEIFMTYTRSYWRDIEAAQRKKARPAAGEEKEEKDEKKREEEEEEDIGQDDHKHDDDDDDDDGPRGGPSSSSSSSRRYSYQREYVEGRADNAQKVCPEGASIIIFFLAHDGVTQPELWEEWRSAGDNEDEIGFAVFADARVASGAHFVRKYDLGLRMRTGWGQKSTVLAIQASLRRILLACPSAKMVYIVSGDSIPIASSDDVINAPEKSIMPDNHRIARRDRLDAHLAPTFNDGDWFQTDANIGLVRADAQTIVDTNINTTFPGRTAYRIEHNLVEGGADEIIFATILARKARLAGSRLGRHVITGSIMDYTVPGTYPESYLHAKLWEDLGTRTAYYDMLKSVGGNNPLRHATFRALLRKKRRGDWADFGYLFFRKVGPDVQLAGTNILPWQ